MSVAAASKLSGFFPLLVATAIAFVPGQASAETLEIGIGTQNTTTNTVTGGVVLKELGLLEKHLPKTGKYKDFKAHLGIDTRTGSDSQALLTIYCDGDKRFAEVVSAKTHKDIAINVKDVGMLRIVVSSRNFLDLHDHATLADARVSQ